jgi:type I restriction enzyme S subunit
MFETVTPFAHPWSEDFISNIGSVTVGGTPHTSMEKYWNGDVPWMASGDVNLKRIADVPKRITQLGLRSSNATLVDPPAVAIGLAGQGKTRGTVALVLCRLCTNQSVALITGHASKVATEYLLYNLEFRYEELRSRSAGDGRAGLSKQLIEQIPVPLPPLCEQNKIAEILSTVDRAIEQTEALISKQERIKTGLMQDLLTRGIDERGKLRSESTHKFKDSHLGRIPKEWRIVHLNEVAQISSGVTLGKCYVGPNTIELPYLRVANVQDGYFDLREVKSIRVRTSDTERFQLQAGDVLMNEGGDFDKLGRGSVWQG